MPIYVLGDIPDLIDRPSACLFVQGPFLSSIRIPEGRWLTRDGDDCFIGFDGYKERIEAYDTALAILLAEFPQIQFFPAREVLCNDHACYALRNGTPFYWNSDHLTLEGGDLVVGAVRDRFPELFDD